MAVKDRVIFVPRGPRGLQGAQGPAGDGATTLTLRLDEMEDLKGRNTIYWNAISGNDANPGTLNYPIQTAERACKLLKANIHNVIYLQSDVVWDYYLDVSNKLKLQISGGPNDFFSVTFTDAINSPNLKGGIRTDSYGTIIFLYSKIFLDGGRDKAVFNAIIGKMKVRTFSTDFELLEDANGYLFSNTNGGEFVVYLQGTNLINSQGHLFETVGAGQDPNDRDLVYCNINSA